MASRDFSTLASRMNPSVPGCPLPMLIQYIRESAIRTCERTLAWRYEQPTFALTPGQYEYTYQRPTDTDVHSIISVTLNDSPLRTSTLEEATSLYPQWGRASTTAEDIAEFGGEPRIISQVNSNKYVVLPTPDAQKTYTMRMIYALKPSRDALDMDKEVFDELESVIMHGALQELLVIPNVGWNNNTLATYHARQYSYRVAEHRANSNLGNMRASLTVRARPLA